MTSAADSRGFPEDQGREVAVVGRSNSGKSSAINRLVGSRKLARVSKTPGRTQLINFFELAPNRRIVDLPGYGFARVPDAVRAGWRSLVEAYFSDRRSLSGLVVTVDIRRGLKELDVQMVDWASSLGVPVMLLLTKADKLGRGAGLGERLRVAGQVPEGTTVEVFSSVAGTGVDVARSTLQGWLDE